MANVLSGKHGGFELGRQLSSGVVRGNGTGLEDSKGLAEERHKGCAVAGRKRMVGGVGLRGVAMIVLGGLAGTVAHAAYKSAQMGVTATVLSSCNVSSSQYISVTSSGRAAESVQVQCSALTTYRITAAATQPVARSAMRLGGSDAGSLSGGAAGAVVAGDAVGTLSDGDSVVTVEY